MGLFALSLRLAVATLTGVAGTLTARSADITRGLSSGEVVIEGMIGAGDCSKLGSFLFKEGARRVYLASPGGSLLESMEIGRLVRALKLETMVPGRLPDGQREKRAAQHKLRDSKSNYLCTSACFFVFAGGIARSRDAGEAILGIHRPQLANSDLERLSSDQAVAAARGIRALVDRYLNEMSVPARYSERMFLVAPSQIEWIRAEDFNADFEGIIPELRDWVAVRGRTILEELQNVDTTTMSNADKSLVQSNIRMLQDPASRELEVLSELAGEAWKGMFSGPNSNDRRRSFCSPPH